MEVDNGSPAPEPEKKERRRSVRGRRSSVFVEQVNNNVTPVEVSVPVHDTLHDTTMDAVVDSLKKMEEAHTYRHNLEEEKYTWDHMVEKAEKRLDKAEANSRKPLAEEGCPDAHAGADGRKARHVLQRTMRTFRVHNQHGCLKHEIDEMKRKLAGETDVVQRMEMKAEKYHALLTSEPADELKEWETYFNKVIEEEAEAQRERESVIGRWLNMKIVY